MDKNILIEHIDAGRTTYQISEIEGKSQTMVMKWLKKFGLKTKHNIRKFQKDSIHQSIENIIENTLHIQFCLGN